MLPADDENQEYVRQHYGADFERSQTVASRGIAVLESLLRSRRAPLNTRVAIAAILADQLRRFSSLVRLAAFADPDGADVLLRTLFEGLLAERFILKRPTRRKHTRRLPRIPSGRIASDFRVALYRAAPKLGFCKSIENLEGIRGFKKYVSKSKLSEISAIRDEVKKTIGSRWYKVLDNGPRTYSGLSVRHLADVCGLATLYHHYGQQSQKVHANRSFDNVRRTELQTEVHLSGDPIAIPLVLGLAHQTFLILLRDINRVYRLGHDGSLSELWLKVNQRNR